MKQEGKHWIERNGSFTYNHAPKLWKDLPPAVYELNFDSFKGEFFLSYIDEKFQLPKKLYSVDGGFVNRALHTFKSVDSNLGILLRGLKGTGKTIIAKQIANESGLPVILVTRPYDDVAGFLNGINRDVIIFFDEFEKMYSLTENNNNEGRTISNLLMLMDGAFTSQYKRLFLLTTNSTYLPGAMSSRPSRIRYVKEFVDLDKDAIMEILNDCVNNKELIPQLCTYLQGLEFITVDIVKSVAEEANIYNTADKDFYDVFNVTKPDTKYDIAILRHGKKKWFTEHENVYVEHIDFLENNSYIRIKDYQKQGWSNVAYITKIHKGNNMSYRVVLEDTGYSQKKPAQLKIKPARPIHAAFTAV